MRRLVAVAVVMVSLTIHADVDAKRDDSAHRQSNQRVDADLIRLYLSLTDLSLEDQRQQMWALSSKTKAALWKYNIERYLGDHPELSVAAQEILQDGILLVTRPAWFDIVAGSFGYELQSSALEEFKRRLHSMLSPQIVTEVFIRLGSEPIIQPLAPEESRADESKPFSLVPRPENYGCTCSGQWECGYFSDYACDLSWCDPVPHCGVFGHETCWGRCKRQIQGACSDRRSALLIEPHTSYETKLAMFGAAVVAQSAGETCVTRNRIIAALLRTVSVGEFLSRARIDAARVCDAVEDPQTPSFEECERAVKRELAEQGIEFASMEHQARIQLRPLETVVREVFDAVLERHGQLGVPPLDLLRDLIRSAPALAERLRPHGLDAESISAELQKR